MNLAASRRPAEILEANGFSAYVTQQAADEALWFEDDAGDRVRIDIATFAAPSPVEFVVPTDEELLTLVGLASNLGIGEASSLAVGQARGIPVATDDRLARRTARAMDPPVDLVSTSELLLGWSSQTDEATLTVTLKRIEEGARFVPPRQDPNASWWREATSKGQ